MFSSVIWNAVILHYMQILYLPIYYSNIFTEFSSVTQLCLILCNTMNRSTPRLPVHHQPQEFTPNPCPSSRWYHPTISCSVVPFYSCPQSFPASGSFPKSWLFALAGQSVRALASASVLLMNIQGWFPLGLTGWSPCCSRDSQKSSPVPQFQSINSSELSLLHSPIFASIHK